MIEKAARRTNAQYSRTNPSTHAGLRSNFSPSDLIVYREHARGMVTLSLTDTWHVIDPPREWAQANVEPDR